MLNSDSVGITYLRARARERERWRVLAALRAACERLERDLLRAVDFAWRDNA